MYTIAIEANSAEELQRKVLELSKVTFGGSQVPTAPSAPAPLRTGIFASELDDEGNEKPKEVKKSSKKTAPVEEAPAEVEDTSFLDDAPAAAAPQSKEITLEDVKQQVIAVHKKLGKPAALKILKQVGAESVSQIPKESYGMVLINCERALA
jgi:hypothetical protein